MFFGRERESCECEETNLQKPLSSTCKIRNQIKKDILSLPSQLEPDSKVFNTRMGNVLTDLSVREGTKQADLSKLTRLFPHEK